PRHVAPDTDPRPAHRRDRSPPRPRRGARRRRLRSHRAGTPPGREARRLTTARRATPDAGHAQWRVRAIGRAAVACQVWDGGEAWGEWGAVASTPGAELDAARCRLPDP